MTILFDANDVVKDSYAEKYDGKYLIFKPSSLNLDYRTAEFQLFRARGGFGCDPNKLGTTVFGDFCADGEYARFSRFDFMGIATDEAVTEWIKTYGEPKVSS